MTSDKPRLKVTICRGKQFGIRDNLDLRVFATNYLGFTATVFGYGLRVTFRLRDALKDLTAREDSASQ